MFSTEEEELLSFSSFRVSYDIPHFLPFAEENTGLFLP